MMMLSCKDMGATDCDFVARGETAWDVKMQMKNHAKEAHKDMEEKWKNMSDEEKKQKWEKMLKNMKCE
ncbi:MAG TPA: DUF1059 domain-containing protein [Patescibacteria group bacterium]|nr:DUF1059 domain-containing protein [Patescibacteria group bacterium]